MQPTIKYIIIYFRQNLHSLYQIILKINFTNNLNLHFACLKDSGDQRANSVSQVDSEI